MRCVAQIDERACIAHGDCALIAPAVFEVNEVARVIGDAPGSCWSRPPSRAPQVRFQ